MRSTVVFCRIYTIPLRQPRLSTSCRIWRILIASFKSITATPQSGPPRNMAANGNGGMDESTKKNITIIGGGIIGCTSAYFLTRHPSFDKRKHRITLLESSDIAGGASGKAGGLLALWAYPQNIVALSFQLHAELAKEHNGAERWGYRHVECGELAAKARQHLTKDAAAAQNESDATATSAPLPKRDAAALKRVKAAGVPDDLDWIAPESVQAYEEMSKSGTTAQVHPYQFTTSMANLARESGVDIITDARVTSINTTNDDGDDESASASSGRQVQSVTYQTSTASDSTAATHTLPSDVVVLAAGAWTSRLHRAARISGQRAHSVTITPTRPISAYALFTSLTLASGQRSSPEIYTRPNNEIYACGEGDSLVPLPETTRDVQVDPQRCEAIISAVGSISDELRHGKVTVRQACYLPVSAGGGGPFIGETRSVKGLIVAAGHTCWGIQNAPATGKCVSELVLDGKCSSAKLGQLEPRHM